MSRSFIGSKIAIVTKSQCRYTGTIIGIDAQASSILLGNVKSFGTENRGGNSSYSPMTNTIVPIMQFANSDIEDLKIVDEEQTRESSKQTVESSKQTSNHIPVLPSPPPPPPKRQPSIHDDPAIVSAVISTSNKDSSISSRLMHDLHHLNLSDGQSKTLPKTEESRIRTDPGELGQSWSLSSPSKWENNNSSSHQQQSGHKSKFFDDFSLNNTDQVQSNRSQQRWPSNTHSTQTSRYRNEQEDDSRLPVRQPFFSDDRSYSHPQQQNRHQNGHIQQQNQQRYFYNNRRAQVPNQQRRPGGGNRETFNDNGNRYDDDFDFETSNRNFNKIASDDELKHPSDSSTNQYLYSQNDTGLPAEYSPLYDKKKSFFDNITQEDTSDGQAPMYNRSRNQDTFGYERYQRQNNRGGYRRPNRQQQGNEDFYYRQNNNNGYQYRY